MSTTELPADLADRLAAAGVRIVVATDSAPVAPVRQSEPTFTSGRPEPRKDRSCSRDPQATQKQVDYIKREAAARGVTHTEGGKAIADLTVDTPGLTHRRVQQVLAFVQGHKPLPRTESQVRRNRKDQACEECFQNVPAGFGILTNEGGHWVVRHEGECPSYRTPEQIEVDRLAEKFDPVEPTFHIDSLLWENDEGEKVGASYADPSQEPGEGNLLLSVFPHPTVPGVIVVRDENPYGFQAEYGAQLDGEGYRGKVSEALRTIVSDPIAAMASFGAKTSTCGKCHRPLRDNGNIGPDGLTSVTRGIGPTCAENLGMFD